MAWNSDNPSFFRDLGHAWVRAQRFETSTSKMWIERSSKLSFNGGPPRAWVLDLDSTLFCVSHRLKRIYSDFLREFGPHPRWWGEILKNLGPEHHRYGVRTTFREILKLSDERLARDRATELWSRFELYWREKFFSDKYISYDKAYEGASEFVQNLHQLGFRIVYLTGRDWKRCHSGTLAALRSNRFPIGENTRLFMKPHQSLSDLEYKEGVSKILESQFENFAFLDNEPENLHMFAKRFPHSEIIFFHSIMSPRLPRESYQKLLGNRRAWRLQGYT